MAEIGAILRPILSSGLVCYALQVLRTWGIIEGLGRLDPWPARAAGARAWAEPADGWLLVADGSWMLMTAGWLMAD